MSGEWHAVPPPPDPDANASDGDDAEAVPAARVPSVPPAAPTAPRTDSDRPQASVSRDSSPATRRRGRMSLRIPDDEVSRPIGASGDAVARRDSRPPSMPPPDEPEAAIVKPMRIISINPPPPPPDSATVLADDDEWTPPSSPVLGEDDGEGERLSLSDVVPVSVDPVDEELATVPHLPPSPSTPRDALAAFEEEGEDVSLEEDVLTPALPRAIVEADGERRSDPGDAPEISAEDLVAVEVPAGPAAVALPPVSLPPVRSRAPSQPVPPKRGGPAPGKPPLVIIPPHVGVSSQPADSPGSRRKGRLWWEDFFNDDYVRTMEKITDEQIAREVDFIEDSLGVERGGAMLDLACGTGRHAIELASRGYELVGFDLSLAMLARAGEEAQDRNVRLNFVQGDMREMSFEEQFDGVYCWNTSFGYFEEEKNALVVDRVRHALKGGGLFLLDMINRDFLVRQSPSLAWFEGDGCVCMDDMSVDFITSRMRVKRTMMLDDGRSKEIEYSMRVYSLHELGKILHEHGFKVCEVSGRVATPGVFFGNESPRTMILAEKR
jgi:SAM-dependent methyltransferase